MIWNTGTTRPMMKKIREIVVTMVLASDLLYATNPRIVMKMYMVNVTTTIDDHLRSRMALVNPSIVLIVSNEVPVDDGV